MNDGGGRSREGAGREGAPRGSDRRGPGASVTAQDIYRWGPSWSRHVGWFLDHVWWSSTVVGAENVPQTGRVLVAPNHTGVIDGPVAHGALPRGSHFLVKEEFFTSRLGFLMRWSGQIPVDRRNGRPALEVARTLLEEDRCVGVFPEGTRGRGDVTATRAGVAWLAVRTGSPVVPCAILGTRPPGAKRGYVPGPRSRLWVQLGEPIPVAKGGGRTQIAEVMAQVQAAMVTLVADAQERSGLRLPD
ncbi:lysophospholipid acyltransferase family protein [Salana multivorans]